LLAAVRAEGAFKAVAHLLGRDIGLVEHVRSEPQRWEVTVVRQRQQLAL